MQEKSRNQIVIWVFQLCVIANGVLGKEGGLYVISKLIMFGFFAVMVLSILFKRGDYRIGKLFVVPVLFVLYSLTSLLWAHNQNAAMNQMTTQVQLFVLLVFTYLAVRDGLGLEDYLVAIYITGFGLIALGLYQQGGLQRYLDVMQDGRIGGVLSNTYGMAYSNAAICAAYFLVVRKKKIHSLSLFLFVFFALSTGSKKASLMAVAGVLFVVVFHYGLKRLYKTFLIGGIVLVIAWYVIQLPIFNVAYQRLTSYFTGEGNTLSDNIRQDMVRFGWQLFKERPLFGYGLGSFQSLYYIKSYSHNNYIEVLVSGGLVGFVLYYAMYLLPVFMVFLGKNKKAVWKNRIYLMLLVWVAVDLVFGYGYVQIYGKNPWILMGVLLGTADKVTAGEGLTIQDGENLKLKNNN